MKNREKEIPKEPIKKIGDSANVNHSSVITDLRSKAEILLQSNPTNINSRISTNLQDNVSYSQAEIEKLIYELEVHQIELEMLNDELIKTNSQLKISLNKYTELYDFSPAGYFTLNQDGEITELNLYGSQLLGKERLYLINSMFGFFVADYHKKKFRTFLENIFETRTKMECDIELKSKNGPFSIELQLSGIANEENDLCHITAIDISERRRIEEDINLKNRELKQINTEKDKFFSIISHDLRGPIGGFLGLTELMVQNLIDIPTQEIIQIAELMKNSASNLNHLMINLLQWSKIQRDLMPFDPKYCSPREIIEKNLGIELEVAKAKELTLSIEIPDHLSVYADPMMVESIFRNLIFNAIKFTFRGGRITVSAKENKKKEIEFLIQDTGMGMDKYILSHLFKIDIHNGRQGTEGESSSGLGLILCKDFITQCNGKISVQSIPNIGSTFKFTLPTLERD